MDTTSKIAESLGEPVLQEYVYSELPAASIRLLRFCHPLSNNTECEQKVFQLNLPIRPPKYHALSYCWGNSARNSSLTCNGKRILITSTLKEALRHLVASDLGGVEWIWIDQICVNQANREEKSMQVNMMREIYRSAEGTIIWLGPEIENIESTRPLLDETWQLHTKDQDPIDHGRRRRPYTLIELEATNLPPAKDRSWQVLAELLSRPWFVRTWIIQEAALSRVHPQMLCGSYKVDWEKLLGACSWMRSMCYNITPLSHNAKAWDATRSLNLFNDLQSVGLGCDMFTLLMRAMRFQASEPSDKVYSLVGLSGEGSDSTCMPEELRADYKKPYLKVFRDVTRYIIQSSANLGIFSLIRYSPEGKASPSWSVDFTEGIHCEQISNVSWSHNHRGWPSMKEKPNKASGSVPVAMPVSASKDILALKGLLIDIVSETGEVMSRSNLESSGSQVLFAWQAACKYTSDRYPDLARAFMVTLAANWSFTKTKTMEHEPLSNFWAYLWHSFANLAQDSTYPDTIIAELQHTLKPQNAADPGNMDAYLLYLNAAYNRRIFFTKGKQYLGLGPKNMQEGDLLCVLFGGATPFILRPTEGHYRFVGECYVYDLMSSEAIRDWEHGIYTEHTFHLV